MTDGKLELMMYVHVDDVFMAGRLKTWENIKEMIKFKFKIQEYDNVNKFLGLYYKWGHDAEGPYAQMTMWKYVNKLLDVYDKFIWSDIKVQKNLVLPVRL